MGHDVCVTNSSQHWFIRIGFLSISKASRMISLTFFEDSELQYRGQALCTVSERRSEVKKALPIR